MKVIGLINLFEKITRAKVKDCFDESDVLVFVVQPGEIRKAVGKGGENIRKVSKVMNKQVKIIQFNNNIEKFALGLLYPLKPETELREGKLILKTKDGREKGKIFGREKSNLRRIQSLINKYFKVEVLVE